MVVEVKTRGPEAYKRWQVLGAERSHPESVAQAALYTYGTFGEPRDAVIAAMDTANRTWDYEIVPAVRVGDAFHGAKARLYALSENYALHGADPEALPERDFSAGPLALQLLPIPQHLPARDAGVKTAALRRLPIPKQGR